MNCCLAVFALLLWLQSPGYEAYRRADKLFVARKFPEALAAVEESLHLDPKLVPALTLHAKMAMAMNRFDLARQSLDQAIAVDPASSYAQFLYGLDYYLSNELQRALPRFEAARNLNPADARTALYLGLTLESLGRTQDALANYEDAVRLEKVAGTPQVETYLSGARLLFAMGRLDESESWIKGALKVDPKSRDAHFEWARLLLEKGQLAEAATEGETALRLPGGDIADGKIHYLLIRAYRESDPEQSARHAAAWRELEMKQPK
jgi:tetratricopeptide (TPR) repeat protein